MTNPMTNPMAGQKVSIGVLDSGHGGLDILKEIMTRTDAHFSYFADTLYLPYGSLAEKDIIKRCSFVCSELIAQHKCDLIVLACNTATAYCIDALRQEYEIPFVGVEPYLNFINKGESGSSLGALVTPNTHSSARFKNLKKLRDPHGKIPVLALEALAPLVEEYLIHREREKLIKELKTLFSGHLPLNWDYTILGCTHYPLIRAELEEVLETKCISPTPAVVDQVLRLLPLTRQAAEGTFHYFNSKGGPWRLASLDEFFC